MASRAQIEANRWSLELGGHCRTGLEDNVRWDKSRLAASNVSVVRDSPTARRNVPVVGSMSSSSPRTLV